MICWLFLNLAQKNLFTKSQPLFIGWLIIRIFSQVASQAEKHTLRGASPNIQQDACYFSAQNSLDKFILWLMLCTRIFTTYRTPYYVDLGFFCSHKIRVCLEVILTGLEMRSLALLIKRKREMRSLPNL